MAASDQATLRARVAALRAAPDVVVLEGFHALKHAMRFDAAIDLALSTDASATCRLAEQLAPDIEPRLRGLLTEAEDEFVAAAAGSRLPRTGVLAFARRPPVGLEETLAARPSRPVVWLENPRHLGNVGAVVRTAAAADAAAVLTTGDRDPWEPSAIRGSAGLHFALPVLHVPSVVTGERPLIAVDPDGDDLGSDLLPAGAVLAFGTERHGLSDEVLSAARQRVRIPMRAGVSSLNLATAVAVVLFYIGLD